MYINIHMHAAAYVKIHKIKEVQMLKISVNMLHSSDCPSHHISGTFCLSLRSNIRYAEEKPAVHAKDILQGVYICKFDISCLKTNRGLLK